MPRKPRDEEEGAVHHVYARGVDRMALFRDDADRRRYVAVLAHTVREFAWSCLSYCLMNNHVHLLIRTDKANLGPGIQQLHGDYGRTFNRRHGREGHLFQGRYGSTRVRTDAQLWTNAAYIALNPVKAGLCRRAEGWRWGSHAATVANLAPDWIDDAALMAYFGALGGEPRERYRAFVATYRAADETPAPASIANAASSRSKRS
jgi:putative transposase